MASATTATAAAAFFCFLRDLGRFHRIAHSANRDGENGFFLSFAFRMLRFMTALINFTQKCPFGREDNRDQRLLKTIPFLLPPSVAQKPPLCCLEERESNFHIRALPPSSVSFFLLVGSYSLCLVGTSNGVSIVVSRSDIDTICLVG